MSTGILERRDEGFLMASEHTATGARVPLRARMQLRTRTTSGPITHWDIAHCCQTVACPCLRISPAAGPKVLSDKVGPGPAGQTRWRGQGGEDGP